MLTSVVMEMKQKNMIQKQMGITVIDQLKIT